MWLSGATLGATGTNDLPEIRTKMNSSRVAPEVADGAERFRMPSHGTTDHKVSRLW